MNITGYSNIVFYIHVLSNLKFVYIIDSDNEETL